MITKPRRVLSRRYLLLVILLVIVYYSGIFTSHTVAPSTPQSVETQVVSGYVKPEEHDEAKPDYIIDYGLQKRIERETQRKRIDRKYCGRDRCQFVLPVAITEQALRQKGMSKAQLHFRQIAFLSGKVGRTVVLPNVYLSHLGACRRYPFDFYYDDNWLKQNKRFFNYISLKDFKMWAEERRRADSLPSGQEVFFEISEDLAFLDKITNCMAPLFENEPRRRFQLDDPEGLPRREGRNYTQIFMDELIKSDVDVVQLFYDRRFGYIEEPEADMPLAYHPRWHRIAEDIATKLQPFVAVHWRMERLEPLSNLMPCAQSLVKKVKGIESEQDIKFFLLTDYPHLLNTSEPESRSFKANELKLEHHEAIRHVYQHLDVTLTTLDRSDHPVVDHELPPSWHVYKVPAHVKPYDPGVLGIVDKLVAMRAQWFFAGKPGVCGRSSSFTSQIIYDRQAALEAGHPSLREAVDTFDL
ncbi:hypothetical protein EC973_008386 [Apophysomyces ossiformis]|uniref:O-fucosyltransferase family protein n=1 Tax=Apophysomyces ossiformis TaxID=679940 RepID=A0A8H7BN52_9FUNG|nr:hypothetical protein EC973_008386 [Apophysomyces ossiformis]